jgi:outer membrane protein OmpA-like peptidoglycan-associated protein
LQTNSKTTAGRLRLAFATATLGLSAALPVQALVPEFGAPATPSGERREEVASYAVPTGPWRAGVIPTVMAEGAIDQTSWKLAAPGKSTLELLQPLRAQVKADGFVPVFECESQGCGGFDFRYGTDILPEPGMHVDLGDYRFLAAKREGANGTDWLTLIVSRSADTGFVQLTVIGAEPMGAPDLSVSTKSTFDPGVGLSDPVTPVEPAAAPAPLALALEPGTPVVLDGLAFASGKAVLEPGDYTSLTDLAAWMAANPQAMVELVGHTDGSGNADANIALSLARAEATRDALLVLGVAADRVAVRGAGPADPIADNATPEGRAQNRRVEVILTPTL